MINSRSSILPESQQQNAKASSSSVPVSFPKKVSKYSMFPVLGLPIGFHGSMVSFRDSTNFGDITSIQAYSQLARHCPISSPATEKSLENSLLDVHQLRESALAMKMYIETMLHGMIKQRTMTFRTEIGVCVLAFDRDGISMAVNKSLQHYSANVVPFKTSVLIRFSYLWASIATNFHLLAIQCLTDRLSDLSNRLCHMSLSMFYFDLLRQYLNGRTFSPTSKLYVTAAKHLNFHLLARPSQQMSVFLQCSPVNLVPIKDSVFSSANYYASVMIIKTYKISLFHV
jgi:hypothetical protein